MPPETTANKEVDITTLEMAFAKDPASDAFISLSEAYLKQGRFMEAMVVCKKGIKSKPDSQNGRVLLARIYAEQGKVPKALDEVSTLLEKDPALAPALVLRGGLLDKQGKSDEAIESFKQALDSEPENEEAQEALKAKGVDYTPPSAAPPPPPEPEIQPAAMAPAAATPAVAYPQGTPGVPSQPPVAAVGHPSQPPVGQPPPIAPTPGFQSAPPTPAGYQSSPPMVAPHGAPPRAPGGSPGFDGKVFDPNQGLKPTQKKGANVTISILGAGIAILGVFLIWLAVHASNLRKIDKLNTEAIELVTKDNAASLGKAVEKLDEVLKMDDGQELAIGLKAFALAVRVHDHGIRDDAEALTEALKMAKDGSETSWRWAAEIMELTPQDPEGAEKLAMDKTKEGYATVQTFVALSGAALANGKLDVAQGALKTAREKGPMSVRAQVSSAEFYRRMLQIQLARAQYDAALKTSNNHALALVGRAMLALEDASNPSAFYSAYKDWESIRDIGRANIGPKIWARAKTVDAFISHVRGQQEAAKNALKEAEEKARNDADVYYMTGRVLLLAQKRDEAIEKLKKSVSIDKNRLATLLMLARTLTDAGKEKEADRYLRDARKLDSSNVQILIAESVSKRRERKYDEAIALLKRAEKETGSATASLELLDTYRAARDFDASKKQFEKLTKAFGETKSVMTRALVTMGRVFLRENMVGPAVESFKTAIEYDQKNAEAYYFRGLALRGDKKLRTEAYASVAKYLELAPGGTYAREAQRLADQLR